MVVICHALRWGHLALLLLFLLTSPALAADAPAVTATLVFDKPQYYLGENILVRYAMTNHGQQRFLFGNDAVFDGVRADRWKVTATDAHGRTVADPYSMQKIRSWSSFACGPSLLDAGKSYQHTLPLMNYCDFPGPGVYTVRVYHTAESSDDTRHRFSLQVHETPVAQGTLRLVIPTPSQANEVVKQMQALPTEAPRDAQGNLLPYADFTTLRYPVYLPIMAPLAAKGDLYALMAIAAMPTREATQTLITLAENPARSVSWPALALLLQRLPVQGEPGPRFGIVGKSLPIYPALPAALLEKTLTKKQIYSVLRLPWTMLGDGIPWRDLPQRSWHTKLRPTVTALGWRLLESTDRDQQIWGAKLLEHTGGAADLPRLIALLDASLAALPADAAAQRALFSPQEAVCGEVHLTADTLLQAGATLPQPPRTLAEQLLTLDEISRRADFRPAGWQQLAAQLLRHPLLYVRVVAAYRLPLPLAPTLKASVMPLAQEPLVDLQEAFCRIAEESPAPQFGDLALGLVDTTQETRTLYPAQDAALACGIPADRVLEHLVNRIGDNELSHHILELLCSSTIKSAGLGCAGGGAHDTPEELARLKARWTRFIADNRAAIRAGTRFTPGQPPVTADLVPHWLSLRQDDDTVWPSEKGQ